MDWLNAFYASIKCRTLVLKFQIPDEPVIEWGRSSAMPKGHFLSYFKARKFVSKGYIYNLVRLNDSCAEVPSLLSVLTVKEFPKVVPNDLLGVPLEKQIEFGINIIPNTLLIYILPYRTAPTDLKI